MGLEDTIFSEGSPVESLNLIGSLETTLEWPSAFRIPKVGEGPLILLIPPSFCSIPTETTWVGFELPEAK